VSLVMGMLSDKLFIGSNLLEVGITGASGPAKGQPNLLVFLLQVYTTEIHYPLLFSQTLDSLH
jgi:hypothetical protein